MSGSLEGKVAVITGTGTGMAREVALRMASEGAAIVGCDIDEEACAETVELVRSQGGQMEALYPLNLTDEANAHRLAEFAAEQYGGVDILYNNAMGMRVGALEDLSADDWQFTLDNTLTLHFLTTKHIVPHLRARGGGSIIFVGSISGANLGAAYPGNMGFLISYACAKAAVLRMTSVLANELAEINVRVNAISPGCIATPDAMNAYGEPGTELRRVAESPSLIPRLGEPLDVAKAALFLASEQSSWVTGQNLFVDGGFMVSGGRGQATAQDKEALAPLVAGMSQVDDAWETTGVKKPR